MSRWLLSELLDCDGGDALGAYPGREYLARRLGVSVSYIKKLFASLHKGEWFKRQRGGAGHLYRYYVRPPDGMVATPEYPPKEKEMAAPPEGIHQREWRPRGGPVAATPVSHSIEENNKTTSRTAGSSQNATRGKKLGWVVEAGDMWKETFGGTAAYGAIGKHLKPLVDEHGWDEVKVRWACYLEKTSGQYASSARFAQTFGVYRNGGPTSASDDVDALFAQHKAVGAL